MKQIDEITLMAYADGELDRESSLEVERAMAADASVAARIDRFRHGAVLLRETYGSVAGQSCPTRISTAIDGHPAERNAAYVSWPRRRWLPLAASIAVAAVAGALFLSVQGPTPDAGQTIVATAPDALPATPRPAPSRAASSETGTSFTEESNIPKILKIGAAAPDIAFTAVNGSAHRLSEFRGRPVMLWLFATWCRTCSAGTAAVAENYDRLSQAGLQIVQLRLHENLGHPGLTTREFAARYAGQQPSTTRWLWGDASKRLSFTYNPRGVPDIYFLIDKDGVLRDAAVAPNVTMDRIVAFAKSSRNRPDS